MHVIKYYTYKKNILFVNLEDQIILRSDVMLGYNKIDIRVVKVVDCCQLVNEVVRTIVYKQGVMKLEQDSNIVKF